MRDQFGMATDALDADKIARAKVFTARLGGNERGPFSRA
jgi:hypothetical protein